MGLLFPLKIKWLSLPNGKDRRDLPSPHFLCRSMRSQTSCIHTKALFSDALLASEILPMFFHTFKQQLVRFAFSCWISLVKQLVCHHLRLGKAHVQIAAVKCQDFHSCHVAL